MPRPSPLQNRCAPDGSLHAVQARGTLMGNRGGRLHDADGRLGAARWRSRAWICCRLAWRGWWRPVMGDGYTEIFFLDEATALAAGHRPCFLCRRDDALAFAAACARAAGLDRPPRAPEMDRVLHAERLAGPRPARLGDLPAGTIFAADQRFHLRTPDGSLPWTFDGYRWPATQHPSSQEVLPVTLPSVRAALVAGYMLRLHSTANS